MLVPAQEAALAVCRGQARRPAVLGQSLALAGPGEAGALRVLTLTRVNRLPVAITSTLSLFLVEDRLHLHGCAGPLLTLFFLSAGLNVVLWTLLSQWIGAGSTLVISMPLAIAGFAGSAFLVPGDLLGFAAICMLPMLPMEGVRAGAGQQCSGARAR